MVLTMTLQQAYAITAKMTRADDVNPTPEMRAAKQVIYEQAVLPEHGPNPSDCLRPDYFERTPRAADLD
jgi:hypothetical protein